MWQITFLFSADCALDFQCLKCLCETATQCTSLPCDHVKCKKIELNNYDCSCGPFGITPPFWMSANKPVLDDKGGTEVEKFKKCVETFPCSIWAVQYYMEKYAEVRFRICFSFDNWYNYINTYQWYWLIYTPLNKKRNVWVCKNSSFGLTDYYRNKY